MGGRIRDQLGSEIGGQSYDRDGSGNERNWTSVAMGSGMTVYIRTAYGYDGYGRNNVSVRPSPSGR
jgi:hypothetical protein